MHTIPTCTASLHGVLYNVLSSFMTLSPGISGCPGGIVPSLPPVPPTKSLGTRLVLSVTDFSRLHSKPCH